MREIEAHVARRIAEVRLAAIGGRVSHVLRRDAEMVPERHAHR
jgi:hypothetical protein